MPGPFPVDPIVGCPFDPYNIYHQARSYLNASQLLYRQFIVLGELSPLVPGHVLELFAIELFMKCVDHIGRPGAAVVKEHSPRKLFSNYLDEKERSLIRTSYEKTNAFLAPELQKLSPNIDLVLDRLQNLFQRIRYCYEGAPWEPDSTGHRGTVGSTTLVYGLLSAVNVLKADWHYIYVIQTLPEGSRLGDTSGIYRPHADFIERQYRAQG